MLWLLVQPPAGAGIHTRCSIAGWVQIKSLSLLGPSCFKDYHQQMEDLLHITIHGKFPYDSDRAVDPNRDGKLKAGMCQAGITISFASCSSNSLCAGSCIRHPGRSEWHASHPLPVKCFSRSHASAEICLFPLCDRGWGRERQQSVTDLVSWVELKSWGSLLLFWWGDQALF